MFVNLLPDPHNVGFVPMNSSEVDFYVQNFPVIAKYITVNDNASDTTNTDTPKQTATNFIMRLQVVKLDQLQQTCKTFDVNNN